MVVMEIRHEVLVPTTSEAVWAALTEADHLASWLGNAATIDLTLGGKMTLTWNDFGSSQAVIETVEEPTTFAFRWSRDEKAPGVGNSTLVTFTLHPHLEGTRVVVVESGFHLLEGTDEERDDYAAGNVEGWQKELEDLQQYLSGHSS